MVYHNCAGTERCTGDGPHNWRRTFSLRTTSTPEGIRLVAGIEDGAALDMTPPSERHFAPDIDLAAFTAAIAAYQGYRRLPDASDEALHEARIARARLRHVIACFVADAVKADVQKSSVVRRVNNHLKALVRSATIEPDASLVSEVIEWIAEGYPDDIAAERARGRPTPVRGRDTIPVRLLTPPTARVS